MTQTKYQDDLASNDDLLDIKMNILRPDYYVDDGLLLNQGGFDSENVADHLFNYSTFNTLPLNKKVDGYHTFDDGLMFQFQLGKYLHLTYFCRSGTPVLDTCNVKLFKMQDMLSEEDEEENRTWKPPFSRNETVLFARLGYHRYFKVNWDVDSMLFTRQEKDRWYKFDYLFSWEDNMVSVFIDGKLNTTQLFHMASDPFAQGQGQ